MPIRKKGNVEIQTSPRGVQVKQTGYTFYSYDKNSAALYFQFREQDGQPTDLAKATVHLVMILDDDNGEKFIPGDDEIEVISAIQGAAKYVLPDNLLGYEGKVTSYVYLEFSDGSHTDEGHFTFEIKRSLVTDVIPEAGDKYVKDFDDIKAEVQKTANSAIKTASEASKSIDEAVKSTESARDEAVKAMSDIDYSNRNLLKGTSDEWEERTFSNWVSDYIHLPLKDLGLQPGDTFTYAVDIDNTIDEVNTDEVKSSVTFRDSEGNQISEASTNKISGGKKERAMCTAEIPEKTSVIRIAKFSKGEGKKQKTFAIRKAMLNCGTLAAPWTLALEDIGKKSELEKIKQAIINLGGEI